MLHVLVGKYLQAIFNAAWYSGSWKVNPERVIKINLAVHRAAQAEQGKATPYTSLPVGNPKLAHFLTTFKEGAVQIHQTKSWKRNHCF